MKKQKHVCQHTEEKADACKDCQHPMTSLRLSTYNGFNHLIHNISRFTFRSEDSDLLLAFRNAIG